ncbi:uncharacterized protein LOC109857773 [Pseudomyrmex gracilis]|uniref:uncharacterized protein LOC109857773 n=1 Tax=Pseudomyrmex gracilis TaxID=219809 RepID=UPI000995D190|nr:uncharacterized protein LOC109857773 [Pseudomyrmex gracilis]
MWYPVFFALEHMSKIFPFPERKLSRNIKDKLLAILNRFLDDKSYTRWCENSASNQFYHEVLKWTCILGGSMCKEHVNQMLEWHFNKPAQNRFLSSWQKWIYCQGLMLETVTYDKSALWQKIFNIYQTQGKEEDFFEFLPCYKNHEYLYTFLSFLDRNSLPRPGSSLRAKNSDTDNIGYLVYNSVYSLE